MSSQVRFEKTFAFVDTMVVRVATTVAVMATLCSAAGVVDAYQPPTADPDNKDTKNLIVRQQKYSTVLGEAQQALDDEKPDLARKKLLSTDPPLRGWEFEYLLSKSKGNKVQWTLPHASGEAEGRVSCMTFTASGKRLILGRQSTEGASGSVSVWDFVNDKIVPLESLGGSHITAVARSRDGKTIAAAGGRGKIVVWDAATGKVVQQYSGHNPDPKVPLSSKEFLTVRSLDFSPDGKQIVSSAGPIAGVKCTNALQIWSVETGKTLMTIKGEHQAGKNRPILSVAFSPDGKTIASGGFDGAITLWDARTGKEQRRIRGPFINILDLEFSPDGKRLACGSANSAIWDVATGEKLTGLVGYPKPVASLTFSPDGKRLITGGWDRTVRIWDSRTGVQLLLLGTLKNRVGSVAVSSDGKSIAAGGPEGRAIPAPTVWSLSRTK
jgi:WD40 repeat protein